MLLQRPHVLVSRATGSKAVLARQPDEATPPAGVTGPHSVVETYGFLQVEGSKVVSSKTGRPVFLRGMSLFWSQWKPQFWTSGTVRWLKLDWNVSLVRAAMAVEEGGYLTHPEVEKARLEAVVQAAIAEGIYVIVDWHDHHAVRHLEQAKAFFAMVAEKYGRHPNVLFEVFNEPTQESWSTTIKPYHEHLVQVIRQHSDNLIILGTRFWSQQVDVASEDPVLGTNLAYTLHFYANTHREDLRQRVLRALANRVAIFATEWGTCDASGDGALDFEEASAWLEFLERHSISHANWAVSDKQEACSALRPGASGAGGWPQCQLTRSGIFVRAALRGEPFPPPDGFAAACAGGPAPPQGPCSASGEDCSATGCCSEPGLQCYEKNEYWAGCRASCAPGPDPMDPPEYRTPWSCRLLG